MDIKKLKSNEDNPRIINDTKFDKLVSPDYLQGYYTEELKSYYLILKN